MIKMKQGKAISNSASDKNGAKNVSKEGAKKYKKREKNTVGRKITREIITNNDAELQQCMGNVSKLVKAFANPFDYGCVRLPSQFQYYPTAVANPFMKAPATWAQIDEDAGVTNATVCYLFRDQFRAAIMLQNSLAGFTYDSGEFQTASPANVAGSEQPLPLWPLVYKSGARVHGDALYPGMIAGSDMGFYWAQPNDVFNFTNMMSNNNAIKIYRYDGAKKLYMGNVVVPAGGNVSYTILGLGYYGFTVSNGTANQTGNMSFSLNLAASPGLGFRPSTFGHLSLPEMYGSFASIVEAAKIYAGSIMLTNNAAPLVRQGKIASAQLPTGRYWLDFTTYRSIAEARDGVTKDAVQGAYSFLKPTQPSDFNFRNETSITATDAEGFYNIIPDSDFLVHYAVVQTAEGRDAQWTLCWGLEYRTTSKWIDVEESEIPDSTVECFHSLFTKIPQHYTNEFHISDIGNWVKEAASKVYGFVKDALPMVVTAGTTAAKVAGTLAPFFI